MNEVLIDLSEAGGENGGSESGGEDGFAGLGDELGDVQVVPLGGVLAVQWLL